MTMVTMEQALLLVGASAVAGAMNAVAGGGTMLTFPALLAAGQLSTVANATSTVALWPGQLSSLFGLRDELRQNARAVVPLSLIGVAGGLAGAQTLVYTPPALFDRIVPFLLLLATGLFLLQEPLSRWQKARIERTAAAADTGDAASPDAPGAAEGGAPPAHDAPLRLSFGVGFFLLLIALYGGYFGAGIGILTLAALGLLGLTNIHQMNGIKAVFTLGVNGVAAALFIAKGLVDWKIAGIMALGSLFGGYAGAGIARRIGQKNVRRIVIAIGLLLSVSLFFKR